MDLNPLDPRTTLPTAGARRRDESGGGFRGLMDLMSHLATEPSRPDDRQRAPEAPAAGRTRGERVRGHAATESGNDRRTEDTEAADRPEDTKARRSRRTAEPQEPVLPPPVAAAVTVSGDAAPVATDGAVAAPAIPETTPAPTPAGNPATANAPAANPQSANLQSADPQPGGPQQAGTATAAAAPAAAPAAVPPIASPAVPSASDTLATAAQGAAALPAQGVPVAGDPQPIETGPLTSARPAATAPAATAPAAQPVAGGTPAAPAEMAIGSADQPSDPASEGTASDVRRGAATRRAPAGVKVSVEAAPPTVRGQGVAPAGLVQAHLAASGTTAASSATGQPAVAGTLAQEGGLPGLVAQPGSTASGQAPAAQSNQAPLHAGGGQALHVGADDGNPQQGNDGQKNDAQQNGGQPNGGQAGGGQPGGGQAQAGNGFAFGAATIGQRGFGGDAARAQFQEILATRTARAPLQGTGQTAGGAQTTTAFTAGPGGPQSMLTTAMASRAEATAQGRPGAVPGTAVGQVAMKLAGTAADGGGRVTIRLNPEELGKVDVKLELGRDGLVRASISAERPETLDMLQRDSRMLEKALQDAGLKTDQQSLSFDLRGGNGQPTERDQGGSAAGTGQLADDDASGEPEITDATGADAGGIRADGSYDLVA